MRIAECTLVIAAMLLALGLGMTPAAAQSANGFSPIAGCSLVAFDANTSPNSVNGAGTVLAGQVNVAIPCDAATVTVSLTTQLITSASATITSEIAASCVAPAVPGGCTVGSPPAVAVPNQGILLDQFGAAARQTRNAEGVFVGLAKGNYTFQANLRQVGAGTLGLDQRSFIVQVTGGLPVTAPGSSQ
jgi:hypothetical protein